MSDELFPSGPWVGFYNYRPGDRHPMDLHLDFSGGCLSGDGNDDVGRFLIRGKYDPADRECHWTKTYPGSHDVFYRGFREGKGIWGTWEIGIFAHGGFHIWPKGAQEGETAVAVAEAPFPAEAIGREQEVGVAAIPAKQDRRTTLDLSCGLISKLDSQPTRFTASFLPSNHLRIITSGTVPFLPCSSHPRTTPLVRHIVSPHSFRPVVGDSRSTRSPRSTRPHNCFTTPHHFRASTFRNSLSCKHSRFTTSPHGEPPFRHRDGGPFPLPPRDLPPAAHIPRAPTRPDPRLVRRSATAGE